jgi:hypothetical protein
MTERQYLGFSENATLILNDDGTVRTMTLQQWKGSLEARHVGALPAGATGVQLQLVDQATLIERYCEVMHDAYERAAVGAGWETQTASRKPWADVPEPNKVTMRAAVAALLEAIRGDSA